MEDEKDRLPPAAEVQAAAELGGPEDLGLRVKCWLVLLLSGTVFGSSFSLAKLAMSEGAQPLGMTFWFVLFGGLFLLFAELLRHGRPRFDPRHLLFCTIWGFLGTTIPGTLFFYAAREVPAGVISIAVASVPILTLLIAILLKRDTPTAGRITGIVLGIVAVVLIVAPETSLPSPDDAPWVLLAFVAAASYAVEHLFYSIRFPKDASVSGLLCAMFLITAVLLLPIVLATGTFAPMNWPLGTEEFSVIGIAAVTVFDYFLFAYLIAKAGPVFTSQAAYVVTLAGVFWGIVIFGEEHSSWIWSALLLLMIGITLVRPRKDPATR